MKIYLKILCRSRIPHSHHTVQYIVSISHVLHWWHSPTLKKKKSYDFNNYRNKIEYIPEGLPRRKNMFRSMNSYASSLHLRVLAWPIRIPDAAIHCGFTILRVLWRLTYLHFTRLRCVFPVLLAAEGLPRRWMVVEVALFLFLGLIWIWIGSIATRGVAFSK